MHWRGYVSKMPCVSCGHVVSATSAQSVSESYFAHREAVHGGPPFNAPRATSGDALRKLVALVQTRG